jgi:hypothetical protein
VEWSDHDRVTVGTAPGGGQILAPRAKAGAVPTVLVIRYPDGKVLLYSLSGGP